MRIPVEFDETVASIDEMAEVSGLSRTEAVENVLRKALAEDRRLIESRQLKKEDLKSEN